MLKFTSEPTSRYYVKCTNKDTGVVTEEVVRYPEDSAKVLEIMNNDDMEIEKGFVADDTPVGIVGNAKMLKIHKDRRNVESIQINYDIEEGVPRFKDFKPIQLDKVKLCKNATDDGDLLKIVPDNQGITLVNITEMNNLRYLLRSVQQFNESLLLEADDDDDEENENEKDVVKKHTYKSLKENELNKTNNEKNKDNKNDKLPWNNN